MPGPFLGTGDTAKTETVKNICHPGDYISVGEREIKQEKKIWGGLNNGHLFLTVLEAGESKVKVQADLVPSYKDENLK